MGINGLNSVFSKKTYLESQPLVSQNVTFLEDRIFTEQVKMRSLRWALIQYDHCPYEKGKFGHRDTHRETAT